MLKHVGGKQTKTDFFQKENFMDISAYGAIFLNQLLAKKLLFLFHLCGSDAIGWSHIP